MTRRATPELAGVTAYLRDRYADTVRHCPEFGRNVTQAAYVRVNRPYALRNYRTRAAWPAVDQSAAAPYVRRAEHRAVPS